MDDFSENLFESIIDHRLGQQDLERVLRALSKADRAEFMQKVGGLIKRIGAFVEVSQELTGSPSLDELLPRLMHIVTESLYAERSSLFLYDRENDELYTRVAQGDGVGEIRIPAGAGIAGAVFRSGRGVIIDDAYADERFNSAADKATGFRTRNILCVPVRGRSEAIGVAQVLNKRAGAFDAADERMLEALASQAASALEYAQLLEVVERTRREEAQMLEVVNAISSELELSPLLARIISVATEILNADRGSLFLYDPKTDELWSRVAEGLETKEIRFPAGAGIAGSVFRSREVLNIPDAYEDERFNRAFDQKTGYRTRSILCVPIIDKRGACTGVVQILNKADGPFSRADEKRLHAFASQASIALENARLFEDVLNMRNFNEAILESLSNGVLTLDADRVVTKANAAARRILAAHSLVGRRAAEVFADNGWVLASLERVEKSGEVDIIVDANVALADQEVSVNLTSVPLRDIRDTVVGSMLVVEDISREKRMKNTMARYMTHEVVEQLLADGGEVLGGATQEVTILFSDVRRFTTISEAIGARDTVSMLNEYFTAMVDVVFNHDGILDKYIGDAIMALFGTPFPTEKDADNAVRVAVEMMRTLSSLNARRADAGKPKIDIGIGISSGEVVAGNIGSPKRMDYTVIGDPVNLAARLESATKQYGCEILLSDFTVERLTSPQRLREVDRIRVKGKHRPVTVYEALGHHDERTFPRLDEVVEAHGAGLTAYRRQDWAAARRAFREAAAIAPADVLTRTYLERIDRLEKDPPPADWDGVWVLATK